MRQFFEATRKAIQVFSCRFLTALVTDLSRALTRH